MTEPKFTCILCGSHMGSFIQGPMMGQAQHDNLYQCVHYLQEKIKRLEHPDQLTDAQIDQIDKINGIAFTAMTKLLDNESIEWDMAWIGDISDTLCRIAVDFFGKTEMEVYPFIEEKEDMELLPQSTLDKLGMARE